MAKIDLVFLHPPSLFDFRKRAVLHGPISDVVPSTPIFEMYPIGLLTLSAHLERADFSTRIINLANKMLHSVRYDPEKEIRNLKPKAFGIDLHWLPHVQGSLAIGEIVKRRHPDVPLIYGGYSATYFHEELIRYPFVDFILRGDATEDALVRLMRTLNGEGELSAVPGLTYKDREGVVRSNPIPDPGPGSPEAGADFKFAMKKAIRFLDPAGYLPFRTWFRYPVTAVFPYRGCLHNCRTCGGSRFACEQVFNRTTLSVKSPETVAAELAEIDRTLKAPAMIIGDILQPGREFADRLLSELKKIHLKNEIGLEFFTPPDEDFLRRVRDAIPKYNVEISPESHDEAVRRAFGRPFDNRRLEDAVEACLRQDCRRIDLFFMIGLPKQTYDSVMETIEYCDYLLDRYGGKKNLHPFIAPLAPFIDPGSQVWETPERFGYRLFARTLEEHRKLMEEAPSWKYFLNYDTKWMSRDEIVAATYEAGLRLNELKRRHGLIPPMEAEAVAERAKKAVQLSKQIDEAVKNGGLPAGGRGELPRELLDYSIGTICYKSELDWPIGPDNFNVARILGRLFLSGMKEIFKSRRSPPANRFSVALTGPDKVKSPSDTREDKKGKIPHAR